MKSKYKKARRYIFVTDGRSKTCKMVWLTGRLCRLYDDVPDGRCGQKYDHVDLFNVGRKWWLSYGKKQNTGSFPTKRAAKAWIDNGGR